MSNRIKDLNEEEQAKLQATLKQKNQQQLMVTSVQALINKNFLNDIRNFLNNADENKPASPFKLDKFTPNKDKKGFEATFKEGSLKFTMQGNQCMTEITGFEGEANKGKLASLLAEQHALMFQKDANGKLPAVAFQINPPDAKFEKQLEEAFKSKGFEIFKAPQKQDQAQPEEANEEKRKITPFNTKLIPPSERS